MQYDVFNGDADGIIALIQLRLAEPLESALITGVKRDISLLKAVDGNKAHSVTVLDISMEKNIEALNQLLNNKISVFYVDHHRPGDIPSHPLLNTIIDTDANTCTSLLINDYLEHRFAHWAIAAAFGDNMTQAAQQLAQKHGLTQQQQDQLKALGVYINYNGYGEDLTDLHFHPAKLYQILKEYPDPLSLMTDKASVFYTLEAAYQEDMRQASEAAIIVDEEKCKIIALPDAPWARRVSGVLGNDLANQSPEKVHAVLTENSDGTYRVSLRAPLTNKQGAGDICAKFPTGGGRAAAAGINFLPSDMLSSFIESVKLYYC
ncbi:DHH family phosphoesterase [Thalassotalea ganghwensis]